SNHAQNRGHRSQNAEGDEPPRLVPRGQNSKGEICIVPDPHSIFVLRFYLQTIRSGREFRKLQLSLSALGPDRVRAPDAVAKQDTILPGTVECRISDGKRV